MTAVRWGQFLTNPSGQRGSAEKTRDFTTHGDLIANIWRWMGRIKLTRMDKLKP